MNPITHWLYLTGGVFMGWGLGANDSANIFGTGVASGLIRYRTAVLVTAIFVILGAMLEGRKCITTISDLTSLSPLFSFICLIAAALTIAVLTFYAIPASTSQAIVGSLMGIALQSGHHPDYRLLIKIVICWICTPIGGIIFSVLLFRILKLLFLDRVKSVTILNLLFTFGILITGTYGAYALGANNVANVTGVYVASGILPPFHAALIGGLSIAIGVLTYSKKTMMTVGKGIVPLDPFSAMITVFSEALTLHVFTQVGVPVSSSQAVVGAVVGIGFARDYRTINYRMFGKIAIGWICTPLAAGLLALSLLFAVRQLPELPYYCFF